LFRKMSRVAAELANLTVTHVVVRTSFAVYVISSLGARAAIIAL